MFPSLNRHNVWDAFNTITDCASAAPCPTGCPRRGALRFAINKIDRKLDRVGTGHCDLYHNVHMDDVKRYVYFDVFCNHAFVLTNLVLRQATGLAIGGPCSSQLASIKCMSMSITSIFLAHRLHRTDSPPCTPATFLWHPAVSEAISMVSNTSNALLISYSKHLKVCTILICNKKVVVHNGLRFRATWKSTSRTHSMDPHTLPFD